MRIFVFLAIFLLPLASVQAQETNRSGDVLERVFTEVQRQVIDDYYRGGGVGRDNEYDDDYDDDRRGKKNNKGKKNKNAAQGGGNKGGLPPGLAKRDSLPPGLAKQLERYGRLPPGLEKRGLPDGLQGDLGDFYDGTDTQIVGSDVLLVETATGVILDILRNVVPAQ